MLSNVKRQEGVPWTELGNGVSRRVLSHTEAMMVVEVRFETGGVGATHTHPHAQSTYVASGAFCFTIEGKETIVRTGDTITFIPNAPHGTICLEAGVLIDVFAPRREDFL